MKVNSEGLTSVLLFLLISALWDTTPCFSQTWSPPVRVSPESIEAVGPQIVVDHTGKIWCGWNHKGRTIYVSYYENGVWSKPIASFPNTLWLPGVPTMCVDTNGYVWVFANYLGTYYDGKKWSDPMFVSYSEGIGGCTVDSSGNVWVVWMEGYYWRVSSSYYDGTSWSDTMYVTPDTTIEYMPRGMATDSEGKPWCLIEGGNDSLYISFCDGQKWSKLIPAPESGLGYGIIGTPDSSIWVSWVARGGNAYVSRYPGQWSTPTFIDSGVGGGPFVSDSTGKLWVFYISYISSNKGLFYSIRDDNSWLSPRVAVDSLYKPFSVYDAVYDPYKDRIWVTWISNYEGWYAIYVSYTQATYVEEDKNIISNFKLFEGIPNPFWNTTQIQYQLPNPTKVSLGIYDISGQLVNTLINEKKEASGIHEVYWDGQNNQGKEMPNGVYFVKLKANDFSKTTKLVYINRR